MKKMNLFRKKSAMLLATGILLTGCGSTGTATPSTPGTPVTSAPKICCGNAAPVG